MLDHPFPIVVLGPVSIHCPSAQVVGALSAAKQHTLGALVAAGQYGVQFGDLAGIRHQPKNPTAAALRMSVARLRDHLDPGSLPDAVDGRYALDVPTREVDAWTLLKLVSGPLPAGIGVTHLRHLLRPVSPYLGLELSPLVERSARELRQARQDLFTRLAHERPELLSGDLVAHLRDHLVEDPFNEQLISLASLCLARTGDRRGALALLSAARNDFISIGLALSDELELLERELLDGHAPILRSARSTSPDTLALPTAILQQLRHQYVGATYAIQRLADVLESTNSNVSTAVVVGPSGVGKSRLCAEVAFRASQRLDAVLFVPCSLGQHEGAFGPFIAAIPSVGPIVVEVFARQTDKALRRAEIWIRLTDELLRWAGDRRLLILVDDAQWLDSFSAEYIAHLARSDVGRRLMLVVAGRNHHDSETGVAALTEVLRRANSIEVDVTPLTPSDINELVRQAMPRLEPAQIDSIGRELHELSGGLPGVARLIIDGLDSESLMLPDVRSLQRDRPLAARIDRLSPDARTAGCVAAVIGMTFDLGSLQAIAGTVEADLLLGLDELVRSGLVAEQSAFDFGFVHVLAQAGFAGAALRSQVAQWNLKAASHFSIDVHRRARHLVAAGPLADGDVVRNATVQSASAYMRESLYREAAAAFLSLETLTGDYLDPTDGASCSRALDLAGSRPLAAKVRERSLDEALRCSDPLVALQVATSGLPEAEPIDGDPVLVANLLRVPAEDLDRAHRGELFRHLARQLAIVGRVQEASEFATNAMALAESPDERVASAIAMRFAVSATSPPDERLSHLFAVAEDADGLDDETLANFLALLALDQYELGDREAVLASRRRLATLGERTVVRRWHGLLFEAMIATDDGEVETAKGIRAQALEVARTAGLNEAENAALASEFVDRWLRRRLEELVVLVDSGGLDPTRSILSRAGTALIHYAAGRTNSAVEHAETVARHVANSPVSQGTAALAMVAEVLSRSANRPLVMSARSTLMARGNSMVVIGAGAACLGPAARYVAMLNREPSERRNLLLDALALADRSGGLLWRVLARRDLAELTGDRGLHREQESLVEGTQLADLVC